MLARGDDVRLGAGLVSGGRGGAAWNDWNYHEGQKAWRPYWSKNNPHFPGLREAAIFHGRFLSEIPKVGVFNSPPARTWETAWVKKPHLWICHFWAFDALWLDGSEWWYQEWALGEWPAPGNRGLCYENWAKKALGTFHHNWRDKLNGASQWRRN